MDQINPAEFKPGLLYSLNRDVLAERCRLHANGEIQFLTNLNEYPRVNGIFLLLKAIVRLGHVALVGLWEDKALYIALLDEDLDIVTLYRDQEES